MVNLYLSRLNSPLPSLLIIYSFLKRCQGGCETVTFGLIIFLIQFGFLLSGCRCTGRVPDKREWLSHWKKKIKKRDLHTPDLATPRQKKMVSDWPEHYLRKRPGNQAELEQYNWELSRGDLWLGAAQLWLSPASKHSTVWPFVTGLPDNLQHWNQKEVQNDTVDQVLNWVG